MKRFGAARAAFARFAKDFEQSVDRSLDLSLQAIRRNRFLQLLFGRGLRRAILVVTGFVGVVLVIVDSVFMVAVTDNAVILRLGKYDRIVDPGLAFKFPFFEQKLIVNTQMRLQENFGFRQYAQPPKPLTEREAERAEHQTEVVGEAVEANVNRRGTGFLLEEIGRGPPLPADYVASIEPAPQGSMDPAADTADVLQRVEVQQDALENVIPPDGRIPIPEDMKMLSGDLNIVFITWSVQYEIVDPEQYLFSATDVTQILRDLAIVGMRTAVGDRLTSDVLASGRVAIARSAQRFMQDKIDQYGLGLEVKEIMILDANPPDEVRIAYHMVNQAKQEMEHLINGAQAEYNSVIPHAKGKAERAIEEARAYALSLQNRSIGEAQRFRLIEEAYRTAPEVTRDRLYLDTMGEVFSRTSVTLVDTELKGILPVFQRDHRHLGNQEIGVPMPSQVPPAAMAEAPVQAQLPEPAEQPVHLPNSSAVRELPWSPTDAPEPMPGQQPSANSRLKEVAPADTSGAERGPVH